MESKMLAAPVVIPAEIQELSRQIEQWRSTRRHRMPMPEPLWRVAANLARQYGVARVARFLRLDYYSLKERLKPPERQQVNVPGSPTFIELPYRTATPAPECSIELEHPRGSQMRIQIKGALPDLTELTRAFWGMKR
jgi:hypothetical protein